MVLGRGQGEPSILPRGKTSDKTNRWLSGSRESPAEGNGSATAEGKTACLMCVEKGPRVKMGQMALGQI